MGRTPATAPLVVLIAEGAERRRRLARALEEQGFVVTAAPSEDDARRVFASVVVDVVVVLDRKVDSKSVFGHAPNAVHLALPRTATCSDDEEVALLIERVGPAIPSSS